MTGRALVFAALLLAAAGARAAESYAVLPPDPQSGEIAAIAITTPGTSSACMSAPALQANVEGAAVTIEAPHDKSQTQWCRASAVFTAAAPGAYAARVAQMQNVNAAFGITSGGQVAFNVAAATASAPLYRGLDGNWFDPAQSGWGLNFVQGDSGALFAVLLTYSATQMYGYVAGPGRDPQYPDWLVMPAGRWITPTMFRGLLYSTLGTPPGMPYDPSAQRADAVGWASLEFSDSTHARLTARYASPAGAWIDRNASIQRLAF